jgi:hypothetical protein
MNCYQWAVLTLSATIVGVGLRPSRASAQEPVEPPRADQPPTLQAKEPERVNVFLQSLRVRKTKVDGTSWDVGEARPDLQVILTNQRSGKTFTGPVSEDTFAVKFELDRPALEVAEGDVLVVRVIDDDVADDDVVGEAKTAITAELLAKRQVDLSFGQVEELRLEFRPGD